MCCHVHLVYELDTGLLVGGAAAFYIPSIMEGATLFSGSRITWAGRALAMPGKRFSIKFLRIATQLEVLELKSAYYVQSSSQLFLKRN